MEVGLGDLIVARGVAAAARGLVLGRARGLAVEHPERDVDALDLLHVVLVCELTREERLSLIVRLEGLNCVVLRELEGQDEVWLEAAGELAGDDAGVATVGAGGRGGRFVADKLRAARRAGVALHAGGVLSPVTAKIGCVPAFGLRLLLLLRGFLVGGLLCFGGLLFLFGKERLNFGDFVACAAVVAGELAGRAVKVQWARTGGALIVRYLSWHIFPLFQMIWL